MSCEFSLIIPVYNIQEYIYKCLHSIEEQTYTDYEVIIIDDGSTDNSGAICDQFSDRNKQFITYHKENGGLSDARNYGIQKANGKFLIFIDGDDYVSNSMLEEFHRVIKEKPDIDVILEDGQFFDEEGKISYDKRFNSLKFGIKNGEKALEYLLKGKSLWAAFGKCYNRNFWMNHHFQFMRGITSEDFELIYKVIYKAQKITMKRGSSYYYRINRKGSIIESFNIDDMINVFYIIDRWEEFFVNEKVNMLIRFGMRRKFGDLVRFYILRQMPDLDGVQKQKFNDIVKKYIRYLKYGNSVWIYILVKVKGIDCLLSLYNFFIQRYRRKTYENISK